MVSTSAPSMNTSATERKRDETFWFEDGTIAIVAQNTEFRVYKGQLAQRFPVFKTDLGTFGASTTAYEGSLNGGPPVTVLIVADSARDWRHVLTLLLNTTGEQRFFPRSKPNPSFELISACIRLGHKYELSTLYQQAMDYLKGHFPTSLAVVESNNTWVPSGDGFKFEHAVGVVNIARLTGETTLLPMALLVCCRWCKRAVEGFTYSDGERETLSTKDLGVCFTAQAKLLRTTILAYFSTYQPLPKGICKAKDGGAACQRALLALSDVAAREAQGVIQPNPMVLVDCDLPKDAPRLCIDCKMGIRVRQLVRKKKCWSLLPSMMGISVSEWSEESNDQDSESSEEEDRGLQCPIQ